MIKLSEEIVNALAPNQSALQNGRDLVRKGCFGSYLKSADETVIFSECRGSGSAPYQCSVDFIPADGPVSRCTCPSRQSPCKHAIGLMVAWLSGKTFAMAEVPQSIQEKREKAEKRASVRKEKADAPRHVNKSALVKKIHAQMEGLSLLNKVINSILRSGLGTLDGRSLLVLEEQARQLGDYYLPGPQALLREFVSLFKAQDRCEAIYGESLEQLSRMHILVKKGRDYLAKRAADPDFLDAETTLEELLGHPWQLTELKDLGRVREDAELLQLCFSVNVSNARMEYVDLGLWADLATGDIYETRNHRPFKAVKHIREDDSFHSVVQVKTLYIYPGDLNKRVRWEEMQPRGVTSSDLNRLKSLSRKSFPDVVKAVLNQIKSPLAARNPAVLVSYKSIGLVEGQPVLEDDRGDRLILCNIPGEEPVLPLLELLKPQHLSNQAVLVRFYPDLESNRLTAGPLSIITDSEIIRLLY
ncbi:MAG: SWIM zinc finger domain-containing protein [Candidatus Xenobiia bacterium LiM19]